MWRPGAPPNTVVHASSLDSVPEDFLEALVLLNDDPILSFPESASIEPFSGSGLLYSSALLPGGIGVLMETFLLLTVRVRLILSVVVCKICLLRSPIFL
jgi:hypothetical protein